MEKITVIGLDLAKNVFQVHGADAQGKKLLSKQFKRAEVLGFFARLPACRVGMEACGGAPDWARRIAPLGHQVKLMAPQYGAYDHSHPPAPTRIKQHPALEFAG